MSLLADQLEETKDRQALTTRMDDILKRLERNLEKMGEQRDRSDFEALRKNLSSLKERMPLAGRETVTREMERLASAVRALVELAASRLDPA